eukprot:768790-Hanusia_phi.AAC.7
MPGLTTDPAPGQRIIVTVLWAGPQASVNFAGNFGDPSSDPTQRTVTAPAEPRLTVRPRSEMPGMFLPGPGDNDLRCSCSLSQVSSSNLRVAST